MEPSTSATSSRGVWIFVAAIPLLELFAELLPVVFRKSDPATSGWEFWYVTIHFGFIPVGGTFAGLLALVASLWGSPRSWRRSLPALALLGTALAYDAALFWNSSFHLPILGRSVGSSATSWSGWRQPR